MIYEAAGAVGVNPEAFTLRELWWMAAGAWKPHAEAMALFASIHRKPNTRRLTAADFSPYESHVDDRSDVIPSDVSALRVLLPGGKRKRKGKGAKRGGK